MRRRPILIFVTLFLAAILSGGLADGVLAQEKFPSPPPSTPSVLPPPDFHFPGNVGRTYLDSDPPQLPQPVQAPTGAPNVVLILLDDTDFGQYGAFGGGVPSPTIDRLAAEGLRYNTFHTTASPVVVQVPDFGRRFWVYQGVDLRTDSFADLGAIAPWETAPRVPGSTYRAGTHSVVVLLANAGAP